MPLQLDDGAIGQVVGARQELHPLPILQICLTPLVDARVTKVNRLGASWIQLTQSLTIRDLKVNSLASGYSPRSLMTRLVKDNSLAAAFAVAEDQSSIYNPHK